MFLTRVPIILLTLYLASGKIYKRCELARELRNFDMAEDEIPTWVCIAQHESNFDTAAMNYGSGDHGLFQISQLYWCSPPGSGYGCNSPCSKFRDDDIADDLQCIRRIYNEHKRISGDGFNAWVVYPLYCKGDNAKYVQDCYDGEPDIASNTTENEITTEEVDEYGDGYQFPALPKSEYGDGYEFPKLPYSDASIHHFVPTKNASAQRISKIIKHKLHKVPYSKTSILNAVLVESNGAKKLPYSKISINHAVPAHKKIFEVEASKLPYSKESIHHFIPVKVDSPKAFEEPVVDKQPLPTKTILVSSTTEKAATTTTDNQAPPLPLVSTKLTESRTNAPPFTVQSNHLRTTSKTHFTTSVSTEKYDSDNYVKEATFKTSTAKSNYFSTAFNSVQNNGGKTVGKSSVATSSSSTINYKEVNTLLNMKEAETTTRTAFTTTTFKASTSSKSPTTNIKASSSTTAKTPLASTKVSFTPSSFSTRNNFVTRAPTSHVSLHTSTPKALQQRAFFDLEGASSTFSPLRQTYGPPTTTSSMKPLTTPFFSYKAFSVTSPSATTKKPAKSFRDYKYPTPSDFPSSTTTKPSERQITFAPDSFFSWLFSSQTLPPIVAPPRPQRPQGEQPNFPRPGPNFGISRPSAIPGQLQPTTTRRPFPLRPNAPRPIRPQQRPFASATAAPRPPSYPSRKPLESGAEHSVLVVFKENATEAPKQVGGSSTESSKGRSFTGVSSLRASEGRAVEVKLDDNFVFIRTKYGYRLFRT